MLTREHIHQSNHSKTEKVFCPEFAPEDMPAEDAYIVAHGMSAKERDAWESQKVRLRTKGRRADVEFNSTNERARLVVKHAKTDAGARVFNDEDAGWLGDKSAAAVDRIYDAICRLSGMTANDDEAHEKNSSDPLGDGS